MAVTIANPFSSAELTALLDRLTGETGTLTITGDPDVGNCQVASTTWGDSTIAMAVARLPYHPRQPGPPAAAPPYLPIKEAPLNPVSYGAVGDGTTVDDLAFSEVWAAAARAGSKAHIYLPANYNFLLTESLDLGALPNLRIEGPGRRGGAGPSGETITNETGDVFKASATISGANIENFGVNATAGDIFNFGTSEVSECDFHHLRLLNRSATGSHFSGGAFISSRVRESALTNFANRSVPMVNLVGSAGLLSDSTFEKLVITDSGTPTTWAMWIQEQSPTVPCRALRISEIDFENPIGGAIRLLSCVHPELDEIMFWDFAANSVNNLISLGSGVGLGGTLSCYLATLKHIGWAGGTYHLGAGLNDIFIEGSGQAFRTLIESCGDSAAGFTIDVNSAQGVDVRDCWNVVMNHYTIGSATAGSAAGTGATASIPAGQNSTTPYDGIVTLTTGSAPTTGKLFTVSLRSQIFEHTPIGADAKGMDANSAAIGLYPNYATLSTSTLEVYCTTAPPANTTMYIYVHLVPQVGT